MHPFVDETENDVVYKDVVVVGNGPSGICLSYMLAGNWPYYTGEPHPGDEMLTARLRFVNNSENDANNLARGKGGGGGEPAQGIVNGGGACLARSKRSKLEYLSSGIEGRSGGRPLALLMDQLQHPCVDAGLDLPPLLVWRSAVQCPAHRIVDHVVLGKGRPGGSWQSMDPNVLTISLSRWMSMPDLDVRHWEMIVEREQEDRRAAAAVASTASTTTTTATVHRNERSPLPENRTTCRTASRIPVGIVAAYYEDYVRRKNLDEYFRCDTVVTSVRPVETTNDDAPNDFGWAVEGFERRTGKRFRYRCKRAVLATGTTDFSNHLGISGEQTETGWVTHNLNDLEARLDELVGDQGNEINERPKPVLVIGAGLSAADAIMAARFRGVPVLHAFRDSANEWSKQTSEKPNFGYDRLQWLPSSMYPEYHKVYEMMADGGSNYPLYKSLPGYSLVSLSRSSGNVQSHDERMVVLCSPDGQLHAFDVSTVAIFIGYKPDLSYLDSKGIGLGKYPDKPIDGKSNPIEVDNITYEVVRAPKKGLYALGTLVGDNFVRFTLGGAFGILAHILNAPMITA